MFYEYLILLKVWEIEQRPYDHIYGPSAQRAEPSPLSGETGLENRALEKSEAAS